MLKGLARAKKVSIAVLIRQGVDLLLRDSSVLDVGKMRGNAIQAIGKFSSGTRDTSEKHDKYLDEAFSHEGIR